MFNQVAIYNAMMQMLKEYGFETMERPSIETHGDVPAIHDEYTIFLPTNDRNPKSTHSFIVFTFRELRLYEERESRNYCFFKLKYETKEELLETLYKTAKVKKEWKRQLYEGIKKYLHAMYPSRIQSETEETITLRLPYNHTPSSQHQLVLYPTGFQHEIRVGTNGIDLWEAYEVQEYRNMSEFLKILESYYAPKTIWIQK